MVSSLFYSGSHVILKQVVETEAAAVAAMVEAWQQWWKRAAMAGN
jgi:hypothetical protein